MIKLLISFLAVAAVSTYAQNPADNRHQFKPSIDCKKFEDGNYGIGCSRTFYQCTNGNRLEQYCQGDLVFDTTTNACVEVNDAYMCDKERTLTELTAVVKALTPFSCKDKELNKNFAIKKCSIGFATCLPNREEPLYQQCQHGLVFDRYSGVCNTAAQAQKECGTTPPAASGSRISSRSAPDQAPVLPKGLVPNVANGAPGYGPQEPIQQNQPLTPVYESQTNYGSQFRPQQQQPVAPQPQPQQPSYGQPQAPPQQQPPALPQQPAYGQPQPQQPIAPPMQTAPLRPEFDCSTRQDGIYASPLNACANFYWKCANRQAFKYNCPRNLFFSAQKVQCGLQTEVPECNGQVGPYSDAPLVWKPQGQQTYGQPQPQAPQQQQPQQPTYPQPQPSYGQPQQQPPMAPQQPYGPTSVQQTPPKSSFDCSNKADGFHESGRCQPNYVRCVYGVAHDNVCPGGLVFSTTTQMCDYLESCLNPTPAPPPVQQQPPANSYGQQSYGQNPYGQAPVQQAPPKPVDNFCQTRGFSEGYHAEGCTTEYYACFPTISTKIMCPAGLVYDAEIEACDHKNNVAACGGTRPTQPPAQTQPLTPYGQQSYGQNSYGQAPVQQAPPKPVDTTCQTRGVSEGYFADGCTTEYYACSPVSSTKLSCPAGLVYDATIEACDHKNLVAACGGTRPTQPPAQDQPVGPYGQQSYGQSSYGPSIQQAPPKPVDTTCQTHGISEGYFALGCASEYYACSPMSSTKLSCPAGLWYDAQIQACDHKSFVAACGGTRPTQPPAQTQPLAPYGQPQQPQQPSYGQPQQQQPIPRPQQPSYGQPQQQPQAPQPQPQQPSYGQPQAPPQQPSMPQPQQPSYGQPQQQPPAPMPQPQQPSYGQPQPQQQQPVARPQPQPQQPSYGQPQQPAQQQPIIPRPQPQPHQPSYGQPQPQAPQQQPPAAPQTPYGQAPIQQTPPQPVESFCKDNNLHDGFNGDGCSPHFFVCALGQTTRLHCPAGLWYDQDTNECARKETIVACGGQKPVTTPAPAQQQPQQGPYGQPIQQQPPTPPEFDCRRRKDGIYVRGCNAKYYVCIQGTVTVLNCPTGTFYSATRETCDFKDNVVECGGQAPTQPPVAAQHPVLIPQGPYGGRQEQKTYGEQPAQQQPATTPAPAWVPYGSQPQPQQNPEVPVATPAPKNNPCAALTNGIYGRKCSRFFFVCTGQKTYDFICPKDQAFNLKTVKCAPKVEITTCKEFQAPQQQPPAQPSYGQPQAPQQPPMPQPQQPSYGQPQQQPPAPMPQQPYGPSIQQAPPKPVDTTCQTHGISEGYFALGCASEYYACSPMSSTKLSCPAGLWYDAQIQACDHKNFVAACGGTRPTQPPAQTQPLTPYGQPQQQPPAPQQPSYGQPQAPPQQPPMPQPQPQQPSYGQPQPQAPQQQQPVPRPQQPSYGQPQQQPPAPQPQQPQQPSYGQPQPAQQPVARPQPQPQPQQPSYGQPAQQQPIIPRPQPQPQQPSYGQPQPQAPQQQQPQQSRGGY